LLVAHGSRDPRPQIGLEQLARRLQARLAAPEGASHLPVSDGVSTAVATASASSTALVRTASLELAPLQLHQRIVQVAQEASSAGASQLQIVPLFLLPGVHLKQDIPAEVARAQQTLAGRMPLRLRSHLGSRPSMQHLLARRFERQAAPARVLLAHGSRRPGSNQPVEAMAARLGAVAAYWSVAPTLGERLASLAQQGNEQIAIVPYFLFPGGITDAIAERVAQLRSAQPQLSLQLDEPLGATDELADAICEGLHA